MERRLLLRPSLRNVLVLGAAGSVVVREVWEWLRIVDRHVGEVVGEDGGHLAHHRLACQKLASLRAKIVVLVRRVNSSRSRLEVCWQRCPSCLSRGLVPSKIDGRLSRSENESPFCIAA